MLIRATFLRKNCTARLKKFLSSLNVWAYLVKKEYDWWVKSILLWKNRTPEEIEKIIEKTAEKIVQYEMVEPAMLFFGGVKPIAYIGGRLGGASLAWLIPLIGHAVDDYFVVFSDTNNIEKLLNLIEEKKKEKDKAKKEKAEKEGVSKKKWKFFSR